MMVERREVVAEAEGGGRGGVVARVERWISTDSDAESRG
jgi:hypothetical protein